MRRVGLVMATALVLAGCIPGGEFPDAHDAPPARSTGPAAAQPEPQDDRPGARAEEVAQLPAPRPAWESRPVTPDALVVADASYRVRPGDTMTRIADRTGAGVEAIGRANAIPPPYTVRAGQRLAIPGGRYHFVRPGQTGIAIARAYGVEWSRIVAANALAEPYVLRVAQRILVPGDASRPSSVAERAAAFSLDVDDLITGGEPALARNEAPARPVETPRRILPTTAAVIAPTRLRGAFVWPVDGRVVKRFGPGQSGERNDGINVAVPLRTPIHAIADGVVVYAGDGIAALGGLVIVKHGDRWTSVYGYASRLLVRRGQAVKRGDTLALSGDTGFADQPELHFELRRGRTPVDPAGELPRL